MQKVLDAKNTSRSDDETASLQCMKVTKVRLSPEFTGEHGTGEARLPAMAGATMEEASYFWRLESHMDQIAGVGTLGSRRNEDIALDMMKFIAGTTGYGRTTGTATGFHAATETKSEDYATHLLDLYTRCLNTVNGKK